MESVPRSFLGLVAVNAPFILLGELVVKLVPTFWTRLLSALLFIAFGLPRLRGIKVSAETPCKAGILKSAMLVGIMELGDKTNLTTLALTTSIQEPAQVLAGICIASAILAHHPRHHSP